MFYFIKKRHPASKTLRRSSNPPFLRSITLWNNPRYRTLWLTRFANLATLFRRNSLIQTEKCSLFREKKCPQSFLKVQIIISHAIRYFCKKKFWFKLCICGCHCDIISRCLSSFVVSWQELKILYLCIYIIYWFKQ